MLRQALKLVVLIDHTTLYDLVEDYEVTAKDAALASLPSTS